MPKKPTPAVHKRIDALVAMAEQAFELYNVINQECVHIRREYREYNPEQATDIGFLLREIANLLDDGRKELTGRREIMDKVICIAGTERFNQGGDLAISTMRCTATPDIKDSPKIPPKNSPEYKRLLQELGVTGPAAEVVSIHFVRLQDYLTKLAADGKNVPFTLTTFPQAKVVYRKK